MSSVLADGVHAHLCSVVVVFCNTCCIRAGFYFKLATADGNPNYVKSSVVAGIGGKALFFGRPQDSFGLGTFYYNLSDELQNSLINTEFRDEAGVEVYYNYALKPWLFFGPDIQFLVRMECLSSGFLQILRYLKSG